MKKPIKPCDKCKQKCYGGCDSYEDYCMAMAVFNLIKKDKKK